MVNANFLEFMADLRAAIEYHAEREPLSLYSAIDVTYDVDAQTIAISADTLSLRYVYLADGNALGMITYFDSATLHAFSLTTSAYMAEAIGSLIALLSLYQSVTYDSAAQTLYYDDNIEHLRSARLKSPQAQPTINYHYTEVESRDTESGASWLDALENADRLGLLDD